MTPIILDFMRRWWYVIAACVGVSAVGMLGAFSAFAMFLLLADINNGVIQTLRTQPVSSRQLARAWWFIVVCLFTAIALPVHLAALGWKLSTQSPASIPGLEHAWFSLGVWMLTGLGLSALIFWVFVNTPQRRPQNLGELFFILIFGAVFGLLMSGWVFSKWWLPKSPADMHIWHWIGITLVPVFLGLSYQAAPRLIQKRPQPGHALIPASLSASFHKHGLKIEGLPVLLAGLYGRSLLIILAMSLLLYLADARHDSPLNEPYSNRSSQFDIMSMYVVLFSAFLPDWFSLRMLRTLPLSTFKLTLILLSVPLLMSAVLGLQMIGLAGFDPTLLAVVIFTAGVGTAMLTFNCHVSSPWRMLGFLVPLSILVFDILKNPEYTPWLAFTGTGLLLVSGLLMHRGFWRVAGYYRPRRAFGMNAGSPAGQS